MARASPSAVSARYTVDSMLAIASSEIIPNTRVSVRVSE